MFTGIVEALGTVSHIRKDGSNLLITISSPISSGLRIDQSISHNGVCLTVTRADASSHDVTAIRETLEKSTMGDLRIGDHVNLEQCMSSNGRFDGHIVQGHVDQVGTCMAVKDEGGSWLFDFEYDPGLENITVEKGSISVNGVSLTCFNSKDNGFTVAIIPYTYEHTNFHEIGPGKKVNLEFDIIGKYIRKVIERSKA